MGSNLVVYILRYATQLVFIYFGVSLAVKYQLSFHFYLQSKSRNNTKNALDVVGKVGRGLISQAAVGDKPKSISSPNLDLSVGRKTLDSISGEDDDEDAEEGEGMGGVKLPDPMALFGGANASVEEGATSAIGSTVSTKNNNC